MEKKFGFSNNQSRNALIFLKKKGLIFREFRDFVIDGCVLNNVMYIGICPEKILEITGTCQGDVGTTCISDSSSGEDPQTSTASSLSAQGPISPLKSSPKERDWSKKYTDEQKQFLDYLLNIKPEIGDPVEKDHATWWIKKFGVEKINIALQVYWQQVEKAREDPTAPMPKHIGKYVRKDSMMRHSLTLKMISPI